MAALVEPQRWEEVQHWMELGGCLAKGQVLYRQGNQADRQYHIRSGMVMTRYTDPNGDELVTGFHLPGDIVGLCHWQDTYSETAIALETVSCCVLPNRSFSEAQILHNPVLHQLQAMAGQAQRNRVRHQRGRAINRVKNYLDDQGQKLKTLGRSPTTIPTPMRRTDLASYLDLSLPCLSRTLAKLEKAGEIEQTQNGIKRQVPFNA